MDTHTHTHTHTHTREVQYWWECILQINYILSFEEITLKFISANEQVRKILAYAFSFIKI